MSSSLKSENLSKNTIIFLTVMFIISGSITGYCIYLMNKCKSEGATDCAVGSIYGTIFCLPIAIIIILSFIFMLIKHNSNK